MTKSPCPVCRADAEKDPPQGPSVGAPNLSYFRCVRCGDFGMTKRALHWFEGMALNIRSVASLSFSVRRRQEFDAWPTFDVDDCERIVTEGHTPSPAVQADIFVTWLGKNSPGFGEPVEISLTALQGILGTTTERGVEFLGSSLEDIAFVKIDNGIVRVGENMQFKAYPSRYTLTMAGWQRYEELRLGSPSGRLAFMAMKFGDAELDAVVDTAVRIAVRAAGFELFKLTDRPRAGLIDDRLRVEINGSRFLIADLTHANNGAYWEAGYAEGRGKPVIYICKQSVFDNPRQKPHFDTNHHLTVTWDPADLTDFTSRLKATIRATISEARQVD